MFILRGPSERTHSLISILEASQFEFYLTGSRFFGKEQSHSSDFDFFVQDSPEVRTWLTKQGFKACLSYQEDQLIDIVYQNYKDGIWVDVQCINDIEVKKIAQEGLAMRSHFQ